jgi:sulfide dehydrogenase cytochrome subunit
MDVMLAAALTVLPFAAAAQDNSVARSLAATCANCHGTDGRSVSTEVGALAGMPKDFIVQRMNEFKTGARPATVMHQLAKGYSDRQIDVIAAYFAAQRR